MGAVRLPKILVLTIDGFLSAQAITECGHWGKRKVLGGYNTTGKKGGVERVYNLSKWKHTAVHVYVQAVHIDEWECALSPAHLHRPCCPLLPPLACQILVVEFNRTLWPAKVRGATSQLSRLPGPAPSAASDTLTPLLLTRYNDQARLSIDGKIVARRNFTQRDERRSRQLCGDGPCSQNPFHVSLCAAPTLNAAGQPRVTLSLR